MNAVWENALVDGRRLLLLLALADNCSDEGMCYPSIKYLADKTRQSERNVQYSLRFLEGEGLIKIAPDETGFVRYFLNLEQLGGVQVLHRGGARAGKNLTKGCTGGVQGLVKTGVSSFIEPSVEPSYNRHKPKTIAQLTLSEAVYSSYPRKVGKKAALKAIIKATQDVMASNLCSFEEASGILKEQTEQFARSPAGQKGSLTPHPATWYNRGSYADDQNEWLEKTFHEDRSHVTQEAISRVVEKLYPEDDDDPCGDLFQLPTGSES